jgi:hypothetical protein
MENDNQNLSSQPLLPPIPNMTKNLYKRGQILTWVGFFGTLLFTLLGDTRITNFDPLVKPYFSFLTLVSYGIAIWGATLVLKAKKQNYAWLLSLLFYLFGIIAILYFLPDKSAESPILTPPPAPGTKKKMSDKTFGFAALTITLLVFWLYYHSALSLYISGVQTQGVVQPKDLNSQLSHLNVNYTVNGKAYTEIDDTSFELAGSTVIVHYDNNDPSNAVFSAENGNIVSYIVHGLGTYYMLFILMLLCLLVSLKAFGLFGSKTSIQLPQNTPN